MNPLAKGEYIETAWAVLDCDAPHIAVLVGNPNGGYRVDAIYPANWTPVLFSLSRVSSAINREIGNEVRKVVCK